MSKLFFWGFLFLSISSFSTENVFKLDAKNNEFLLNNQRISTNTDYLFIESMLGKADSAIKRNFFTDYYYDSINVMFSVKNENAKLAEIAFGFNDKDNIKNTNSLNFLFYIDDVLITKSFSTKDIKKINGYNITCFVPSICGTNLDDKKFNFIINFLESSGVIQDLGLILK